MHHIPVPRGYPLPRGPRATTGARDKRHGTPGRTFPPKGFVYGTSPVYIKRDAGRGDVSLKETSGAGQLQGRSPSCRTSVAAGPTRTAVIVVGRFLTATVSPELGFLTLRIGFYVRAFIWASVLSRGAGSMWLTTSTPGPLVSRFGLEISYNGILSSDFGSTVTLYGTGP
jgi:hypothetical protein